MILTEEAGFRQTIVWEFFLLIWDFFECPAFAHFAFGSKPPLLTHIVQIGWG